MGKQEYVPLPTTSLPPVRSRARARGHKLRVGIAAGLCLALPLFYFGHSKGSLSRLRGQELYPITDAQQEHRRPLTLQEREELFLSTPSPDSALESSRVFATHPHLAGSSEDLLDAKAVLHFFQDEFGIHRHGHRQPIFKAGTKESRQATLHLTDKHSPRHPTAWIDTYYPVLNTGKEQKLEILGQDGSPAVELDLIEDGNPGDEDAHKYKTAVPSWHGLSRDGDVTGAIIYANYGNQEDYDELSAKGVDLTGKIVVVRYGGIFRGLKIKGAQERGAIGVLIYSDPRDDGYVTVQNGYSPYPEGPARNPTSIQRGSVQFLSSYPGDPTTPGYPAYEDAERTEGTNIPAIPSLPISWQNAQRLLEEIGEVEVVDENGRRSLTGKASESQIRLLNRVDNKVTPIWNAMASIPGHIKDEVVIVGCHRDAWVLGAADPTSGTVSLLEIVRGFGQLLRKGWKPLRTIVIASWDAEEYGLVGSTEWGEDFADWISQHAVAYLNVDVSVAGSRWVSSASPSLAHLIQRTAKDVPHPTDPTRTLWDARKDDGPFQPLNNMTIDPSFLAQYIRDEEDKLASSNTEISPLGSGSDFTVFLQRLGVASEDNGFGFTPTDAVYHYHSIYDSQPWQERYGDPDFTRHAAVAKHLGLLALRIVDSIIVPLNTTQYSFELDAYLDKVEALLPGSLNNTSAVNLSSLRSAISSLQQTSQALDAEKQEAEAEFLKLLKGMPGGGRRMRLFGPLKDWIKGIFGVKPPLTEELARSGHRHAESWGEYLELLDLPCREMAEAIKKKGLPFPIRKFIKAAKRVGRANKKLIAFERGFISKEGIKDREWYKHLGVAPGKWLGYGATTLPALTEAVIYEKDVNAIHDEAKRLQDLLEALAERIKP